MSKHMQLTVRVRPYYQGGLKAVYPKIARHIGKVDKSLIEEDHSLYDLVGKLDQLLYALDGDAAFKKILLKHKGTLSDCYRQIQVHIADWELAQADKALYALEDVFDKIEWETDDG